jgi:arylsulfatase B
LIKEKQRVFNGYFHTSDILPTLASAAEIKIDKVDGFNQWDALVNGSKSPRNEVVMTLDNVDGHTGIISGNWKIVNGTTLGGIFDGYLGEIQKFEMGTDSYSNIVLSSRVGKALMDPKALRSDKINLTPVKISNLRRQSKISCNDLDNPIISCNPLEAPCLFNIIADPCERKNLADIFPSTLSRLRQRMIDLARNAAPSQRTAVTDPRCDPSLHQGTWSWWIADNAY